MMQSKWGKAWGILGAAVMSAALVSAAAWGEDEAQPDEAQRAKALVGAFMAEHEPARWARVEISRQGEEAMKGSSGHAEADWGEGACRVLIDPVRVGVNWGASTGGFGSLDFVALHEVAHCLLYMQPRLGWRDAGYEGRAPEGLLDELWAMDAAYLEGGDRRGFFILGHEAFADALAQSWLMSKGVAGEQFQRVAFSRDAAPMDFSHDTASVSRELSRGDWLARGWSPVRAARAAAAARLLASPDYGPLSKIAPEDLAKIVAGQWCDWLMNKEAAEFARVGSTDSLGRAGPGAGGSLADPMPELVMPKLAVSRIRQGAAGMDQAEHARCKAMGVEALTLRYGPWPSRAGS